MKFKRSADEPQKKRSRPASIDAVIDVTTSYVKGQLVRPLSGAGRWLLFGIVGMALLVSFAALAYSVALAALASAALRHLLGV